MIHIFGTNVPEAYYEGLWQISISGAKESSRNGEVLAIPGPVMLTIHNPTQRMLFDPVRDANPFFHLMEFVWMMAGSRDAEWISMFNKRMMEYADDGNLQGAYGWRWRQPHDQIKDIIGLLRDDPGTRQAVLSMWDPTHDHSNAGSSDRPCNTHIYFRVTKGKLDMTICNRSNDMIWGMLGANAVHMTMLHELISLSIQIPIGEYRVFTNNLHVYPDMPRFDDIMSHRVKDYTYQRGIPTIPLLQGDESYIDFVADCKQLVESGLPFEYRTYWMREVGARIYDAYLIKDRKDRLEILHQMRHSDVRKACLEWVDRRKVKAGS